MKKNAWTFLFLILLSLIVFPPVSGQSPLVQPVSEIPLPHTGINENLTPYIHIANNAELTLNYPYAPDFFVYNENGSLLWNTTLTAEQSPWVSSTAISPDGQNILITQLVPACCHGSVTNTSSNKIILFNKGGRRLWEYPTYSPPLASTIAGDARDILVGTNDNRVISLDWQGTPRWETRVDAPVISLITSADNNTIVATGESNYYASKLYGEALNPHDLFVLDRNGSTLWSYQTRWPETALVNDDGSVIAVLNGRSGNVMIFNRTGSLQVEKSLPGTSPTIALAGDGSLIVVRTAEGFVYGFDRQGSLLWRTSVESGSQGNVIVGIENNILIGNGRNVSLYTQTGNLLGDYPVDNSVHFIYSSPDRQSIVLGTEQNIMIFSAGDAVSASNGSASVGIDNIKANNFQNVSSAVGQKSDPNPAPLSSMACIGALICAGQIVSVIKRDFK